MKNQSLPRIKNLALLLNEDKGRGWFQLTLLDLLQKTDEKVDGGQILTEEELWFLMPNL